MELSKVTGYKAEYEAKRRLQRYRRRMWNTIKTDLRNYGCEDMERIPHDKDQWPSLVNTVL
jgi:hypothetical protein